MKLILCTLCRKVLTSEDTPCMLPCGHYTCYDDEYHKNVLAAGVCNTCENGFDQMEHADGEDITVSDLQRDMMPPHNNGAAAGGVPPVNPHAQFDDSTGAGHGPGPANPQAPLDDGTGAGHDDGTGAGHEPPAQSPTGIRRPVYNQETEWSLGNSDAWVRADQGGAAAESSGAAGGYPAPSPLRRHNAMALANPEQGGAAAEGSGAAGGYPAPSPLPRHNAVARGRKRDWYEMDGKRVYYWCDE